MMAKPWALIAACTAVLAGCTTPAPPMSWLSLPVLPPADAASAAHQAAPVASAAAPGRPVWVVQRVRVPEYLQSAQVRYRDAPQRLIDWPEVRWAERLEVNLSRHLAQSLAAALPPGAVCEAPCHPVGTPGSIWVTFQALDYVRPQRQVVALVRWERLGAGSPSLTQQWQWSEPVESDTPDGQAEAMARVNRALATHLATVLRGVQPLN